MSLTRDLVLSRSPAAGFAVNGIYWGAFGAMAPVLKAQTGLSDAGFGLALLVGAVGAVLAMWLAPLADRVLGRATLWVCSVLLVMSFLAPGLATGGIGFAVAMVATGATSGTLDVIMNARVSGIEARHKRPLMNLNHAVFSFAYAASALGAGVAREMGVGPLGYFTFLGLVALGLSALMREAPLPPAEAGSEDGPMPPWSIIIPGGLIMMIAFMTEQATEGWSALHLERNLGAGAAQGALGPAILGLTMGIGRLSGQVLAQRVSEGTVIRWASTLAAVGAALAALAPSLALAYAGFAILGLGVSGVAPMGMAWIGRRVPDNVRVQAISRLSVVGYAGFFIGPPLMGFLAQGFGLPVSFGAIALLLICVPVVLVPLLRRRFATV